MNPATLIEKMQASGLTIRADAGDLVITPPGRLTAEQINYLRQHKAEILAALTDTGQPGADHPPANDEPRPDLPDALTHWALAVCRAYGDDDLAQAEMLSDLAQRHPDDWPALEKHFRQRLEPVTCGDCSRGEAIESSAIVRCLAGVDSGLATGGFRAATRHMCPWYQSAEGELLRLERDLCAVEKELRNHREALAQLKSDGPSRALQQLELEQAQQELEELTKRAKTAAGHVDLLEYLTAHHRLKRLKDENQARAGGPHESQATQSCSVN